MGTAPNLTWITSTGGPLLLIGAEHLEAWEGAEEPSGGRAVQAESRWNIEPDAPATDYDRACDVEDYVGIIPVGTGHGLVFPDKMTTTWWSEAPGEGTLIRGYSEHPDLLPAIRALPDEVWEEEPFVFPVGQGALYLLDSAFPGSAVLSAPHLVFTPAPGSYRVRTHLLDSPELGWFALHRLTPAEHK